MSTWISNCHELVSPDILNVIEISDFSEIRYQMIAVIRSTFVVLTIGQRCADLFILRRFITSATSACALRISHNGVWSLLSELSYRGV